MAVATGRRVRLTTARRRWEHLLAPVAVAEIGIGIAVAALATLGLVESPLAAVTTMAGGLLAVALPGILLLRRSPLRYYAHLPILLVLLGSWVSALLRTD